MEVLKELQYSDQVIFQSHSQISPWSGNETGAFLYHLCLASFPGRSHLQFLIAYCMQKWRGKAWEKESRA